jgi:hypothetical protein
MSEILEEYDDCSPSFYEMSEREWLSDSVLRERDMDSDPDKAR